MRASLPAYNILPLVSHYTDNVLSCSTRLSPPFRAKVMLLCMIREITWVQSFRDTSICYQLILQTNYKKSAVCIETIQIIVQYVINNHHLKDAIKDQFWSWNYTNAMYICWCHSWLSLTLCWKCKRSRIMDLWWAVGNTVKADCGRLRQAWLSVLVNEVDWVRLLLCGPVYLLLWIRDLLSPRRTLPSLPRSFNPKSAWPLRNLTLRLPAAPPGTCQPFTSPLGEHLEGDEARVGLLWSIDMVTDRTVELSDFREMVRLFFSLHRSNTNSPSSASYSVYVCCYTSVSFSVCCFLYFCLSRLSFISFFNCTHRSCRLWCMHSWSWQSRPGNVWFTDPLLTYWVDLPFTFQRPGILTVQGLLRSDSACLTTVENHSKYAAYGLTDWHAELTCHST